MPSNPLKSLLSVRDPNLRCVFVTGAGISAESGIPTFRGPEGYWTVGSRNYTPAEIGTWAHFQRAPEQVWCWYLFRRRACNAAQPNPGHLALVDLERHLQGQFTLITQNVDGVHLRAGNSRARTLEVHGNGDHMRVGRSYERIVPIPEGVPYCERGDEELPAAARSRLTVDGQLARPHILWFDEYYEERLHRSTTALKHAAQSGLFVTVGSSGSTNLPLQAAAEAARNGAVMIDINPNENAFSRFVQGYERGLWLQGSASLWLPKLAGLLGAQPAPGAD